MRRRPIQTLVLAAALAGAGVAQAQVVNLNFTRENVADGSAYGPLDRPSDQAPIPYVGDRFNEIYSVNKPVSGLIDSEGNTTRLRVSKFKTSPENAMAGRDTDSPMGRFVDSFMYVRTRRGGEGSPEPTTFNISGFAAMQAVPSLTLISTANKPGRGATFTVNGQTLAVDDPVGAPDAHAFVEGQNYVTFRNLQADLRGRLQVSFVPTQESRYVALNGIQIQLSQDPASSQVTEVTETP